MCNCNSNNCLPSNCYPYDFFNCCTKYTPTKFYPTCQTNCSPSCFPNNWNWNCGYKCNLNYNCCAYVNPEFINIYYKKKSFEF